MFMKVNNLYLGFCFEDAHKTKQKQERCTDPFFFFNVHADTVSLYSGREYYMFRKHASSPSHESGPHTCEVHPHMRERMHVSET